MSGEDFLLLMLTNIPKSYKGKSPKEIRKCKHQAFTDKS
ncbi:hypothetical protein FEDK69T_31320 [Flavobacterium enshiense DK69]|nr:hypothetical protein FEDK69T_31320 [Flavobacterium enshiense DK69]